MLKGTRENIGSYNTLAVANAAHAPTSIVAVRTVVRLNGPKIAQVMATFTPKAAHELISAHPKYAWMHERHDPTMSGPPKAEPAPGRHNVRKIVRNVKKHSRTIAAKSATNSTRAR